MSGGAAAHVHTSFPPPAVGPEAGSFSVGTPETAITAHPPKLDVFEGITDEIATVFDGPARKQSYRKSKSSLRYLLIRADVAKLWYFKDAAKSRCKGIISLEEAVIEENPKQFDHRREVHCVKIFAQRSTTLASFKWWVNREFFFSFDSPETKMRFVDAVRQAQSMVVEGWTFCTPSSATGSESYSTTSRYFVLPKFEFVRSSSMTKALSGMAGSKSMRWLIDTTDKMIGAVRAMKTATADYYPTAVCMKGNKYLPAGSLREMSEHEIPINSELYSAFHLDFISSIWISYRSGFPPIRPSTLTSDSGWGCMLRCGQMVLAGSLIRIYVGNRWRFSNLKPPPRNYIEVIKMFADDPAAPFSIHNVARTGQERFNLPIGQWFSPTAVSDVLAYLTQVSPVADDLAIHVARDAAIYRSEVVKLAQTRHSGSLGDQGVDSSGRAASAWRSVLVLVPLRLGSHDVNEDYLPQVHSVFGIPQCMGMLGGRPGSAFYYVASRGEELFYLDPHTTQRTVSMNGSYETSSYHCRIFRHMRSCDIDPSVCFCFLCSDEAAFNEVMIVHFTAPDAKMPSHSLTLQLCARLQVAAGAMPPLVSVSEAAPAHIGCVASGVAWGNSTSAVHALLQV
jgi:cysteine protease ATG4